MLVAEVRIEQLWGTVVTVDVRDPVDPTVLDGVFDWFHRVDEVFSTWRDDSEITRLGRGLLDLADVSSEVREVLELCDHLRAETWGAFEVNFAACGGRRAAVPTRRGALDAAAPSQHAGARSQRLPPAAGRSSPRVPGRRDPPDGPGAGEPWCIGIQHPHERDAVADVVRVSDAGIATSGRYERGDHVIDPRTGTPATRLVAATVIHPELALADAYATALVALGSDSASWLREHPDVAAMTVDTDGVVTLTATYERYRLAPTRD